MKRHMALVAAGAFVIFVTWLLFAVALDPQRENREAARDFAEASRRFDEGRYMEAVETFRRVADRALYAEKAWLAMGEAALRLDPAAYPIENAVNYFNNAYLYGGRNAAPLLRKAAALRRLAAEQKAKRWEFDGSYEAALGCYEQAYSAGTGEAGLAYEIVTFLDVILHEELKVRFRYDRFVKLLEYIAKIEKAAPGYKNVASIKADVRSKFDERIDGALGAVAERAVVDGDVSPNYLVAVVSFHNYGTSELALDLSAVSASPDPAGGTGESYRPATAAGCKSEMKKGKYFIVDGFEIAPLAEKISLPAGGSARASFFFELQAGKTPARGEAIVLEVPASSRPGSAGLKLRLALGG